MSSSPTLGSCRRPRPPAKADDTMRRALVAKTRHPSRSAHRGRVCDLLRGSGGSSERTARSQLQAVAREAEQLTPESGPAADADAPLIFRLLAGARRSTPRLLGELTRLPSPESVPASGRDTTPIRHCPPPISLRGGGPHKPRLVSRTRGPSWRGPASTHHTMARSCRIPAPVGATRARQPGAGGDRREEGRPIRSRRCPGWRRSLPGSAGTGLPR